MYVVYTHAYIQTHTHIYTLYIFTTRHPGTLTSRSVLSSYPLQDEDDEVCYASLQVKKLKKKKKKKKKVQHSDFSTYSEVRTERKRAAEDE